MRLRRRIFVSYLVVAILGVVAAGGILYDTILDEARGGVEARLRSGVRALTSDLARPDAPADTAALDSFVDRLALARDARITIVDGSGRVIADSEFEGAGLAALDDHSGRPEIRGALERGESASVVRYSRSVESDLMYRARRIEAGAWRGSVARIAVPLTRVEIAQGAARRELLLALLVALGAALVAAVFLSRHLAEPVRGLARGAERLIEGDLSARTRVRTGDEIEEVSRAFDEAADRLAARITEATEERDRLEGVLDGMVEGVVVTGADGRITIANAALHRLFGMDRPAPGRTVVEALRNAAVATSMREAAADPGHPVTREVALSYPERRTLQLHAAGLPSGGAVGVLHDVTALKRLEEIQREFVANVSHELKTPLAIVSAYAESLAGAGDLEAEEVRESAGVIRRHVERLDELVGDLLEVSRLESAEFEPALDEVAVGALFGELEDEWGPRLTERGLALRVGPVEVDTIRADGKLLRQALGNLLDNAARHAAGGSSVGLSARAPEGAVELAVEDDGPGIPRDELPRLFDRFYRLEKGRTRSGGGTGLGLAIVRHVAEVHDGRAAVESELGVGTTFRLILPRPTTEAGNEEIC